MSEMPRLASKVHLESTFRLCDRKNTAGTFARDVPVVSSRDFRLKNVLAPEPGSHRNLTRKEHDMVDTRFALRGLIKA